MTQTVPRAPLSREHRTAIGATWLGITQREYQQHIDAGEHWCSACKTWHPIEEMARRARRVDGLDNICKRVANERVKARQARQRAERKGAAS
jgi:hypothetical protein